MNSNSQANKTRQPMTATSRAYRRELIVRAFTDETPTDIEAQEAGGLYAAGSAAHLRCYLESGGTSGKADDPYTDEEMGLL